MRDNLLFIKLKDFLIEKGIIPIAFPGKSPAVIAEVLKYIIKDKVVCDMGCGQGDLMLSFQKYAKKVIGIEKSPMCCRTCRKKGLEVIEGDYCNVDFPEADVYYFFSYFENIKPAIERIKKGIIIITGVKECGEIFLEEPLINIPHKEGGSDFKIQIIKK